MKVINSNLFVLPGNPHMLHLGTIQDGMREYIAMLCMRTPPEVAMTGKDISGQVYIEEAVLESKDFSKDVYGHLKFIEDQNLANEIALFAGINGLLDIAAKMDELMNHPGHRQLRQHFFGFRH
jgi:hypothetical protein